MAANVATVIGSDIRGRADRVFEGGEPGAQGIGFSHAVSSPPSAVADSDAQYPRLARLIHCPSDARGHFAALSSPLVAPTRGGALGKPSGSRGRA